MLDFGSWIEKILKFKELKRILKKLTVKSNLNFKNFEKNSNFFQYFNLFKALTKITLINHVSQFRNNKLPTKQIKLNVLSDKFNQIPPIYV